jgi:hypothetical protein
MHIQGTDYLAEIAIHEHFSAKMVFNEHGAIVFPVSREHRDQSGPNISYADNYKGNALAAMLAPNSIEIRYHREFSDEDVARILSDLLQDPRLAPIAHARAIYQGRPIKV